MDEQPVLEGHWVMTSELFMHALRRVAAGEDPDMVYAEMYANSDVTFEDIDDDE